MFQSVISEIAVGSLVVFVMAEAYGGLSPKLEELQREELKAVVHPGDPEKGIPFWNVNSPRFIYPPAFDFKPFGDAKSYRFRVYDANDKVHSFIADIPYASLAPIWTELPCGQAIVICEAMGGGFALSLSGVRVIWKSSAYAGQGAARKLSYREAAIKGYEYVFAYPPVKKLMATGHRDHRWFGFGYPAKMYASLVSGMVRYMKIKPECHDRAMRLIGLCLTELEKDSFPADSPLAGWPRTYSSRNGQFTTMPKMIDKTMLIYPCNVGLAFLDLYSITRDSKHLAAAERIAELFLKTRRADGTWPLVLDGKTGEAYGANELVPDVLMTFFRAAKEATGKAEYAKAEDACLAWLDAHTFRDYNWDGQFEDVDQRARYENLTGNAPRLMARYLLDRFPGDTNRIAQARDMIRFAEDQFVVWERMYNPKDGTQPQGLHCGKPSALGGWVTNLPAAFEQYDCYCPVNSSAATAILAWLAIGKVTGNALDIAKARSMADKMVDVQLDNGCIPTWWNFKSELDEWVNCQIASANALYEMASQLQE